MLSERSFIYRSMASYMHCNRETLLLNENEENVKDKNCNLCFFVSVILTVARLKIPTRSNQKHSIEF